MIAAKVKSSCHPVHKVALNSSFTASGFRIVWAQGSMHTCVCFLRSWIIARLPGLLLLRAHSSEMRGSFFARPERVNSEPLSGVGILWSARKPFGGPLHKVLLIIQAGIPPETHPDFEKPPPWDWDSAKAACQVLYRLAPSYALKGFLPF